MEGRPRRSTKKPDNFYKEKSASDAEDDAVGRPHAEQPAEAAVAGRTSRPRIRLGTKRGHPQAAQTEQALTDNDGGDAETDRSNKRTKQAGMALPTRSKSATPLGDVLREAAEEVVSSESGVDAAKSYKEQLAAKDGEILALKGRILALQGEIKSTDSIKEMKTRQMQQQFEQILAENQAQYKAQYEEQWMKEHQGLEALLKKKDKKFQQDMAKVLGVRARYAHKVDDEEVSTRFSILCSSVQQLVKKHFHKNLAPEAVDTREAREAMLSKEFRDSLNKQLVAPHITWLTLRLQCVIEAWIWSYIHKHVLLPTSTVWAGEAGRGLRQATSRMETRADELLKSAEDKADKAAMLEIVDDFHEWRGLSFALADKLLPSGTEDRATEVARQMISCIRSLLLPEAAEDAVVAEASNIVAGVAKLYLELSKCRASYSISLGEPGKRYGMRYDPRTMEEKRSVKTAGDRSHKHLFVDLIVAPGLFKTGSSEGVKDGTCRTLKKMEVLCNLVCGIGPAKMDAPAAEVGEQDQQQGNAADGAEGRVEESGGETGVILLDD